MRSLPLLAAFVTAALVAGTILDPQHWVGHHVALVVVAYVATAFVAFSWWELWSTRHER